MANKEIRTGLSTRGYTVVKEDLTAKQLQEIKSELTVAPIVHGNFTASRPAPFSVYLESQSKLYLPKVYGLERFGVPQTNKISTGQDIDISFHGTLRPEQLEPVHSYLEAAKDPLKMGGIITIPCGGGKCLGVDTPVIMFDGTVKKVQDIQVGDRIMGDDSTSRTILSTCRGQERLYKIIQEHGDPYIVNESHILSLMDNTDRVIDMSVLEYLGQSNEEKEKYAGYRVPVDLPSRPLFDLDPYDVGFHISKFKTDKLPDDIKYNDRNVRMQFLQGVRDGNVEQNGLDGLSKSLAADIRFVERSVGCSERETVTASKHIKSKISLEPVGCGDYYGFEIDGNRRFLLGDCTVTHNTVLAIYIMCHLKKKTLIVAHKDFLLQQWKERIEHFAPGTSIGILKAAKVDVNHDIVLASLQSLSMKEYDASIFADFGLLVMDEVHHTSAKVFSEAFKKVNFTYSLGLSATPHRKDGLSKVFKWHIGDLVYNVSKRSDTIHVLLKRYYADDPTYSQEVTNFQGMLNAPCMISRICEFAPRIDFVLQLIRELLITEPDRKILILSERRDHVDAMVNSVMEELKIEAGPYYGGMKDSLLKKSAQMQVIGATFQMTSEGLDIPGLNTLILASPKTDIVQSVGRIVRDKPEDRLYTPLVIDIVDDFSVFKRQAKKRYDYYHASKYHIEDPDHLFVKRSKRHKEGHEHKEDEQVLEFIEV